MKKTHFTPALAAIAVLISACSTMPTSTSLLDQTRSEYLMAQNNPNIANYAALELKDAGDALAQANTAADSQNDSDQIDKLAYIAKQKIALAQEVAKQKAAEAEVANADKVRDQMRLAQRTDEADRAQSSAEQSKMTAQAAQGEAAEAQRKAQEAQARSAQLESQLGDLATKKTDRGMVVTIGDLLFNVDQARLTPEGLRTAQKLADVLQKNPQLNVVVEGYTDSTGSAEHNQELSMRRADAVRTALQQMGVDPERVALRGYGEANPVAPNDTAQNRRLNRRVEIVLSDTASTVSQR